METDPTTRIRKQGAPSQTMTSTTGPDPLSPRETRSLARDLSYRLFINTYRVMWRESKFIFILIFLGFLFLLAVPGSEDPSSIPLILSILVAVPLITLDMKYHVIYRTTLFHRSNINYLYPSLLHRGSLVKWNIHRFLIYQLIAFTILITLATLTHALSEFGMDEILRALISLLCLKFIGFTIVNCAETGKRKDRFRGLLEFLYRPVYLLIMVVNYLFALFILLIWVPRGSNPIMGVLMSTGTLLLLMCTLPIQFLIFRHGILPYADRYWQEDRNPVPMILLTHAARHSTLFGEEGRELDRGSDLMSNLKLIDESRFRMKEKGIGIRSLDEKLWVVFWRDHFNDFLSLLVPVILITAVVYPFLDPLLGFILLAMVTEVFVIALLVVIAWRNPFTQEPAALENTLLLPFGHRQLLIRTLLQFVIACYTGIIVLVLLVTLAYGPPDPLFSFRFHAVVASSVVTGSLLLTLAILQLKHNFYPTQMQRGAAQAFPIMLAYLFGTMGYMILSVFNLFEDVLVTLYTLITCLVLVAGPFACTRLLRTISIH